MEILYDEAKAKRACAFVSLMPASSDGKPLQLVDWQTKALSEFYGSLTPAEDDAFGPSGTPGYTGENETPGTADGAAERGTVDAGALVRAYQYLYLELTKKQGKTELAAALAVMHLMDGSEINGEIYIVAADRDNAAICFNAALYKLRNTPALAKLERKGIIKVRESSRAIWYSKTNSLLKVLSSESKTKHGYKPSCVIFDELHAQPNRDLWDVMTFGAGDARRQPVWIVLTTAGDDPDRDSIGWEIHEKAVAIRDARRLRDAMTAGEDLRGLPFLQRADPEELPQEIERLLDKDDPRWLPVLYGLSAMCSDDEDAIAAVDIYDEAVWMACNPSIGRTVKLSTIREEARNARKSEAAERLFRWLRLNQWVSIKSVGWIPLTVYDKTQWHGAAEELLGKRCYGGLDLSSTTDLTAWVLYFPPQAGLETGVLLPYAWVPDNDMDERERHDHARYRDWARAGFMELCPGDTIDYEAVKSRISEDSQKYELTAVGVDPYLSRTITQALMEPPPGSGLHPVRQIIEIPQTISGMWPAMWETEQQVRKHLLLHVHNTAARYCFGNIRCRSDANGNLKPDKKCSRGRIDITVAGIIAVAAALVDGGNGPTLADNIANGAWGM